MKRFLLLLSLLSITLFGCQVELGNTVQEVSDISFNEKEITITQDNESTISVKANDNRTLNKLVWTTEPSTQDKVIITQLPNNEASVKALKKGNVTIKVTEEKTGKTTSVDLQVKEKPVVNEKSNISISATKSEIPLNEEVTITVKATDNRRLNKINFTVTPKENVKVTNNTRNGEITLKGLKAGIVSITAKEAETNETVSIELHVKEESRAPIDPSDPNKIVVSVNNNTSELIPDVLEITEDHTIDVRVVGDYNLAQTITYFNVTSEPKIDGFIETKQSQYSYKVTFHADKIGVNDEVKVKFTPSVGPNDYHSKWYTIRRVEKLSPVPPKPVVPESKPGSGEVERPSEKPAHQPNYKEVIKPNTTPNPKLEKLEIIPNERNYGVEGKEKVYWLGGIEPPTQFKDYTPDGTIEFEYDPFGNIIEGSGVISNMTVPNYYVLDVDKNTTSGKPNWYNVIKSYSTSAPDSAMCWAMASAGALHWWFDYLGEDYTDKLFYIRENRKDMVSSNLIFNNFKGNNIDYKPLDHLAETEEIVGRSGIGAYAVKSYQNKGGDPRDLFRLYFLNDENLLNNNPNYKRNRALGLLNGMKYNFGSGTNQNNDEMLWENIPLSNRSRNDIVNAFKKAINEQAAVVLSQGNIPDKELYESEHTPAHAIIVWGVIFDESEENLVGLYIGDNNLKEGNLARIDLVYKQLSNEGGRYYYAAPYVNEGSSSYLRQTSIYGINLLYPPTQSIKNWIDDEATKLNYPSK